VRDLSAIFTKERQTRVQSEFQDKRLEQRVDNANQRSQIAIDKMHEQNRRLVALIKDTEAYDLPPHVVANRLRMITDE